jgi:hypothetical protein
MQILMVSTLRGLLNGDDVVGGVGGGLNLPSSQPSKELILLERNRVV